MTRLVLLLVLGCGSKSDAPIERSDRPSDRTTEPVVVPADTSIAPGVDAAVVQIAADRTLTMTLPRPASGKPVTARVRLPDGWWVAAAERGVVTLRPVKQSSKLPEIQVLASAENLELGSVRKTLQEGVIARLKTSVPSVQVRRVITDAHRDHRLVLSLENESELDDPRRYVETVCLAYVESGGFAVELKGTAGIDDAKLVELFEAACATLVVPAVPR